MELKPYASAQNQTFTRGTKTIRSRKAIGMNRGARELDWNVFLVKLVTYVLNRYYAIDQQKEAIHSVRFETTTLGTTAPRSTNCAKSVAFYTIMYFDDSRYI